MTINPFSQLDTTSRIVKRAQYEAFEFSLLDGDVCIRNESHHNPADHEYRVTVVDGVPAACECPADAAYDGPCKHRVAVAWVGFVVLTIAFVGTEHPLSGHVLVSLDVVLAALAALSFAVVVAFSFEPTDLHSPSTENHEQTTTYEQ